jgi:hypothetical protein
MSAGALPPADIPNSSFFTVTCPVLFTGKGGSQGAGIAHFRFCEGRIKKGLASMRSP